MKKVLYICPNGYLGGAERFVIEAAMGHKKFGTWEPAILFFSDGEAVERAKSDGTKVYVIKSKFRMLNIIKLFKAVLEIRSIIKRERPDVIQGTMPYGYIVTWLSVLFLKIRKIWFQHGPVGGTLDLIANQLSVDFIIYNSQYLWDEHHKTPRYLTAVKYEEPIIHYGIAEAQYDSESVAKIREKYLDNEQQLIVSAGRICSWKGYETILKAVKHLKRNHPQLIEKFRVLIIGDATRYSDIAYRKYLIQYVQESDLEDIIKFEGFKKDIQNYYRAADYFVHASSIPEPFGLTVAEAMKQGTLVIGSSKGGVRDILEDSITGLSFDTTSEDAYVYFAHVLEKVLKTDFNALELSENGKKRVDEYFNIPRMVSQLEKVYSYQKS